MIKYTHMLLAVVLLFTAFGGVLVDWPVGRLFGGETPPPDASELSYDIYLPLVINPLLSYTVTGKVTDVENHPLAGATITSSSGQMAVTGADGYYALDLPQGSHALAPQREGYIFTPAVTELQVTGNVGGQNFVALQACDEALVNGGFESNTWWMFPSSDWPAVYASDIVHSGARAVRSGILEPVNNRFSYSSVLSSIINVPAGSGIVTLRLWLYPISGEAAQATLPAEPPGPAFGESTTAYDAQYVVVLDASNNLLETLLWVRSNNQMWTHHEFNLSKWAGQSVKIAAGVYNDGSDGVTAMYIDDASLQICSGEAEPPTTPASCANYLANSGFEYSGAWGIPATPYPAGYSTDYAYWGVRSMRTGVPLWSGIDRYSYSDAWQTVTIPANATSAVLRMKLLPLSQETTLAAEASAQAPPPQPGDRWGEAPLAGDAQYVLVLDPYNYTILETLLWWNDKHSPEWKSKQFDLLKYRGRSIRIQFGTYNNGNYRRSVMYVDEAYMDICTSTVTPTPTLPPPACTEKLSNGGFEYNSAWYIPYTEFSAGYSTFLAHSGARSMRSGIYYQAHNRYSYSDFRQTVGVPYGVSQARLSFWTYAISGEVYAASAPELPERPTAGFYGPDSMSGDVQYLLILDYYGNWIDTLLWRRSNEQYWRYWEFDLRRFAGTTIKIQFGTYNNGWGGVTAMYVDDASLWVCP